jgi:hypothetical protein
MSVLMKCGCVSQGVVKSIKGVPIDPPKPACVVHDCYEPADSKPDLTGRTAECAYLPRGHADKPSSFDLAFFEYRGPGCLDAERLCKCGYARSAHEDPARRRNLKCKTFSPHGPWDTDKYYCGCRGWD